MRKQPTKEQIVYFAGFFDGEGCIQIEKSITKGTNTHYALRVSIEHTFIPVLELLRDAYGGGIVVAKKNMPHYKQKYVWKLNGRDAHRFILDITPYLWEKKPQALLADEYVRNVGTGSSGVHRIRNDKSQQEHYHHRMQELKRIEVAPGQSVTVHVNKSSNGLEQLRLVE